MIAEFDAMVGQYMDTVRKAGVWDQTVFIVTSDHGDMQMEHQQHYKMVPYEASASVPMVIYDGRKPLASPGKIVSTTSQLIDIFPTILEYGKVDASKWPKGLDGQSLRPLFSNDDGMQEGKVESGGRVPFVVSQFHGDNIAMSWFLAVETGIVPPQGGTGHTFKLIIWGTGAEVPSMLFDLDEDEAEMHNLIADPNYAKIRAGLQARIKSVVDYPVVAHEVASYGKSMFRQWINVTTAAGVDWRTEIHKKSLRWTPSWDFDAAGSIAAVEKWLVEPVEVKPCRGDLVWPPQH